MAEREAKKDPWVVVSAFYPTFRVHQGTTELELMQSPYTTYEIEGPKEGFETKREAIKHGIEVRDLSCWFDGWDDLHGEFEDSEDEDEDEDKNEKKEKEIDEDDDEWHSSDLENGDNDEEQTISIMLLSQYEAELARRTKILQDAYMKRKKRGDRARKGRK